MDPMQYAAGLTIRSRNILGLTLALLAFGVFAISDLCAKLLHGLVPPTDAAFFGGLFGIILLPLAREKGQPWSDIWPHRHVGLWLFRSLSIFAATLFSIAAFMLLPMPEALALMFLLPLCTNILSILWLKEPVTLDSWIATLTGFAGILIILRPGFRHLGLGEVCALGAALSMAVNVASYRSMPGRVDNFSMYSALLFGLIGGNFCVLLFTGRHTLPTELYVWARIFGYGFLMVLGQLGMMWATALIPPSRVSLCQYSQMLWALAFSALIFHDHLDALSVIGIAVVTLSGGVGWSLEQIRKLRALARSRPARLAGGPSSDPDFILNRRFRR